MSLHQARRNKARTPQLGRYPARRFSASPRRELRSGTAIQCTDNKV